MALKVGDKVVVAAEVTAVDSSGQAEEVHIAKLNKKLKTTGLTVTGQCENGGVNTGVGDPQETVPILD